MSYGFSVTRYDNQVITGNESVLVHLGSFYITTSGAGSITIPGARYAIATPSINDAISPRVDVNTQTGVISWPELASETNLTAWIGGDFTYTVAFTLDVFGEARDVPLSDYGSVVYTNDGQIIAHTGCVLYAEVAAGTIAAQDWDLRTTTINVDTAVFTGATGDVNFYAKTIAMPVTTSTIPLVFVRGQEYVGLLGLTNDSVDLICRQPVSIEYRIFAGVKDMAPLINNQYDVAFYDSESNLGFLGSFKYLTTLYTVQKDRFVGLDFPRKGTEIFDLDTELSSVVTTPFENMYVCLNSMRGPTTSSRRNFTCLAIKSAGYSLYTCAVLMVFPYPGPGETYYRWLSLGNPIKFPLESSQTSVWDQHLYLLR